MIADACEGLCKAYGGIFSTLALVQHRPAGQRLSEGAHIPSYQ